MFCDARVTLRLSLLKSSSNAVLKASSPRSHPSECIMTLRSDSNLFECRRSKSKDGYSRRDINFRTSSKTLVSPPPILPICVNLHFLLIISPVQFVRTNDKTFYTFFPRHMTLWASPLSSSVIYSPQRRGIWAAPLMTVCAAGSETKTATCTGRQRPTPQVIEGRRPSVYPTHQHAWRPRRSQTTRSALSCGSAPSKLELCATKGCKWDAAMASC